MAARAARGRRDLTFHTGDTTVERPGAVGIGHPVAGDVAGEIEQHPMRLGAARQGAEAGQDIARSLAVMGARVEPAPVDWPHGAAACCW